MKPFISIIAGLYYGIFFVSAQPCEPASVDNTSQEPFRYICYLRKFNAEGKAYTSTAFLIAPRVLLTNAHNVYNATEFVISPGHNGQGKDPINPSTPLPFGYLRIKRTALNTFYHENFIQNQSKRTKKSAKHFDYAVIILPDNSIYDLVKGYLELALCDIEVSQNDELVFAGYPRVKKYNANLNQKLNRSKITGYYENRKMISYQFGTRGGASGSPVMINKNGKYKVVGIHGYGKGCQNSGVKISEEVINKINNWTQGL